MSVLRWAAVACCSWAVPTWGRLPHLLPCRAGLVAWRTRGHCPRSMPTPNPTPPPIHNLACSAPDVEVTGTTATNATFTITYSGTRPSGGWTEYKVDICAPPVDAAAPVCFNTTCNATPDPATTCTVAATLVSNTQYSVQVRQSQASGLSLMLAAAGIDGASSWHWRHQRSSRADANSGAVELLPPHRFAHSPACTAGWPGCPVLNLSPCCPCTAAAAVAAAQASAVGGSTQDPVQSLSRSITMVESQYT